MIGNSFHCVVVALLLGSVMFRVGYLKRLPTLKEIGKNVGGLEIRESASTRAAASTAQLPSPAPLRARHGSVPVDCPAAESNAFVSEGFGSRVGEIPEEIVAHLDELEADYSLWDASYTEYVCHLFQDESVIDEIHHTILQQD